MEDFQEAQEDDDEEEEEELEESQEDERPLDDLESQEDERNLDYLESQEDDRPLFDLFEVIHVDSDDRLEETSPQNNWYETTVVGAIFCIIRGIGETIEFSQHESLDLVRYPQCPHNNLAIKVFNSSSIEVGYLYKVNSDVLAPLIDVDKIIIEGETTNETIITHESISSTNVRWYDRSISIAIRILAKPSDLQVIQKWLKKKNLLVLDHATSFGEYEGNGVKENSRIERIGTLEQPEEVIKTELLDHQKKGLSWLVDKEGSDELPPFWEVKDGLYENVLTRHRTDRRPEPLHGGIFADDYGLGKTLTLLSLIARDKAEKTGEGVKVSSSLVAKQTLIVCPSILECSTWENQLEEHTKEGSLNLYKYYSTEDVAEELKKYDIVLTTYRTLVAECLEIDLMEGSLRKIEWWRVILDEAHVIKNAHSKKSLAVSRLTARRRWAVTGRPIDDGWFDLFPLMAFLRLEPLSRKGYWQRMFQRPLANLDKKGLTRLQVLMAAISLRRTKDRVLVGFPSKRVENILFPLSKEESNLYKLKESDAKDKVQRHMEEDTVSSNYSVVLNLVSQLRQLCDDSALLCSGDLKSLLLSDNIKDASEQPELHRELVDNIQGKNDCVVCSDALSTPNALITICKHVYCKGCISELIPRIKAKCSCPLCRCELSWSKLFQVPSESSRTTPSKVSTLINHLKESRDENSSSKSVVFSEFEKMLVLLEEPLREAGFNTLRLDASTDGSRREETIKVFGRAGLDTVLLVGLKTPGVGENLTAASRVYLLEPWWNSMVEEHAIGRVYQCGQQENVRIVRLIAKNTIEEKILKMQERKKEANEDFGWQVSKERSSEVSIDDLQSLLFG